MKCAREGCSHTRRAHRGLPDGFCRHCSCPTFVEPRRKPLRAKHWGIRPDPAGQRRRRKRARGQYQDLEHLRIVRTMECSCAIFDGEHCWGPVDPHHAGEGVSCRDPERRKTCDRTAIPICRGHHREIECLEGYFKLTWNKVRRRQFYDVEIAKTRAHVNERRAA